MAKSQYGRAKLGSPNMSWERHDTEIYSGETSWHLIQPKRKTFDFGDVTMNREPVENRLQYVTIQFGWHAKQITIQLE